MCCCGYVVFVVVDFLFLYLFSTALIIGPWVIMYVIFVILIIRFWALLCNQSGSLLTSLSGRYPLF
jgi:hypothetical protein